MTMAAVVDRLVHHSTIFELDMKSYRRRHASVGSATAKPEKQGKSGLTTLHFTWPR